MRLVIDTNIVFSGLLYGGKPFQVLQSVANGHTQAFEGIPILTAAQALDVLQGGR